MTSVRQIPPLAGLLGAHFCSLVLAIELGAGFHLRGLTMNVLLGLVWLLVMAFAVRSYRLRGLWTLIGVPLFIYCLVSPGVQLSVACAVKGLCP